MKIEIQQGIGIDAGKLRQIIFDTIAIGRQCEAHQEREVHKARLKLLGKQCGRLAPSQGDLFGGEES